jgi:hypothetical protein
VFLTSIYWIKIKVNYVVKLEMWPYPAIKTALKKSESKEINRDSRREKWKHKTQAEIADGCPL